MVGRIHIRAPLAAAVALLALGTAGSAGAAKPTIYVNYTLGCTFTIADDSGRTVTAIPAGDYQILVRTPGSFGGVDLSGIYDLTACTGAVDFSLTGPGVSIATTLDSGDGDSDFLYATFLPGSVYTAADGHQPTVARATFSTTSASLSSTTPSPTSTPPGAGTTTSPSPGRAGVFSRLAGGVSTAGRVTLMLNGKAVKRLPPGQYVIAVDDRSARAGFFVTSPTKPAKVVTSVPFKGRRSALVNLTKGKWLFYPTATGKKTSFVVG